MIPATACAHCLDWAGDTDTYTADGRPLCDLHARHARADGWTDNGAGTLTTPTDDHEGALT